MEDLMGMGVKCELPSSRFFDGQRLRGVKKGLRGFEKKDADTQHPTAHVAQLHSSMEKKAFCNIFINGIKHCGFNGCLVICLLTEKLQNCA